MNGPNQPKKEGQEKGESGLGSLMNFIPGAYYDLIARVCPGVAFWVAISFVKPFLDGLDPRKPLVEITGPVLFVLILLSYVSGIVLTGFSLVWDALSLALLTLTVSMREHLGLEELGVENFTDRWTKISRRIDEVVKEDDNAGRTLVKAMAEVTLCQNLLSGLLVLACLGYASGGKQFYSPTVHVGYFLPIAGALFVSMLFRQAMFLGRVKDLYSLYVSSKHKRFTPHLHWPWGGTGLTTNATNLKQVEAIATNAS